MLPFGLLCACVSNQEWKLTFELKRCVNICHGMLVDWLERTSNCNGIPLKVFVHFC